MTSFCENGATQKSARQKSVRTTIIGTGSLWAVGGWPMCYRCVSNVLCFEEQKGPQALPDVLWAELLPVENRCCSRRHCLQARLNFFVSREFNIHSKSEMNDYYATGTVQDDFGLDNFQNKCRQ